MSEYDVGEKYFLHAYNRMKPVLDHGRGVYLYDTEGKKYLDFYSGIGVNFLGYGYPKYTEALHKQIDKVLHVSNYFYTPPAIEAAQKVVEATRLDKVFFCNSGAEATEGALKLARKYYYQKNGKADSEIISFKHSFHGRTTGAVRLTGNKHYQEAFGPLIDNVKFGELNNLDSVKALITDKTAAIIVEPLQGEGGVNPCTKEFLQGLRALCDEHDMALILDEVQCGMGRTGTFMTYFQYDIMPDILCLAKGLGSGVPVGAFVANKKYAAAMEPGDHGSTYGGNPFVCAAICAVFDILKEDHIIENVQKLTPYLEEQLDKLAEDFTIVTGHRGIGFMQGLIVDAPSGALDRALLDEGLIVVTAGPDVIRMLPPLIITKENIDEAMRIFRKVLPRFEK